MTPSKTDRNFIGQSWPVLNFPPNDCFLFDGLLEIECYLKLTDTIDNN